LSVNQVLNAFSCAENVLADLRITRKEPPALRIFLSDPLIVIDFIVIYIIVIILMF
jgi:hypothetical protein